MSLVQSPIEQRRREIIAEHGVVAAGNSISAAVGVEIMQRGGNAIDAGVAAAFVAQLAEPGMCGVGGNGMIALYHARRNETAIFDDVTVAPAAATPDMYEIVPGSGGFYGWSRVSDDANLIGHRSVAIPGTVAGLCAAQEAYGELKLNAVLAPAIELAERGVPVDSRITLGVAAEMPYFDRYPALKQLLLVDDRVPVPGTFWEPGDHLRYPDLANTYRLIADQGADGFYKGPIAEAIVAELNAHGGILSYDDLASYRSSFRVLGDDAFRGYRGLRYTPGGSTILIQLLNTLENFDLAGLKAGSVTYRHVMLEILRGVWTNHFAYAGEPGLLTEEYARRVAQLIQPDRLSDRMVAVNPRTLEAEPLPPGASGTPAKLSGQTTTLAVADGEGNVFNILTSLGNTYGSKVVVPGTGIVLNDHMCNFDPVPGRPLSLGPSRRPAQGAHVPIFFRDGRPTLALSAPGARRSMSGVIHTIVHHIDLEMGLQEAIEAPRVWAEALFAESFLDGRISDSIQRGLRAMGHDVLAMDAGALGGFGRPTAVSLDHLGRLHAGADPMYGTGAAGF